MILVTSSNSFPYLSNTKMPIMPNSGVSKNLYTVRKSEIKQLHVNYFICPFIGDLTIIFILSLSLLLHNCFVINLDKASCVQCFSTIPGLFSPSLGTRQNSTTCLNGPFNTFQRVNLSSKNNERRSHYIYPFYHLIYWKSTYWLQIIWG